MQAVHVVHADGGGGGAVREARGAGRRGKTGGGKGDGAYAWGRRCVGVGGGWMEYRALSTHGMAAQEARRVVVLPAYRHKPGPPGWFAPRPLPS